MKSKMSLIIIVVSVILLSVAIFNGIKISKFEVLSISQIEEKDNTLNQKIEQASILTTINYTDNIDTLEDTFDQYIIQKNKYEEISDFSVKDNKGIYETKTYDIVYLWDVLGKYATIRNLNLGIDVKSATNEESYNLNFNVSGTYGNISQFITDLENDSDLYFRIYNFKMTPASDDGAIVNSTFIVKNINIDSSTITAVKASEEKK